MKGLFVIFLPALAAFACGCAPVISKAVLKEADRQLTVDIVQSGKGAYAGKKILWGGVILSSENLEKTTELEALETGLDWGLHPNPEDGVISKGRFIVEVEGYLETAVFKPGRKITIAGVVKGVVSKKIGGMDYTYPVITPVEMKLAEPQPKPAPFFCMQGVY